ncbi:single-stranded-DNA-specific exonuclease RecJ [Patescibacteria group bacterium]|nr:single-stranded-DNA-specific exonuclease RecJ [Patescibacteria group bacterium]
MQWEIKTKIQEGALRKRREEIGKNLLANRGVTHKKQVEEFLDPPEPETLSPKMVGIQKAHLTKAITRIKKAIQRKESVVVYGDYDADGICSTAILWETLHALGAQALPFIPHREDHGYGLSVKGIKEILNKPKRYTLNAKPSLIITVDNGIVAHDAAAYANEQGIDVIICDHHEKSTKLPEVHAIVHTTRLAGSGVTWMFAKEILNKLKPKTPTLNVYPERSRRAIRSSLDLVTIGTIADQVALVGPNRSIVKYGLNDLRRTKRVGIIKLMKEAAIDPHEMRTYHINFVIAPRLNAMGRLEHAIDALRLVCTKNAIRARKLANTLSVVNRQRQQRTKEMLAVAKEMYLSQESEREAEKIIIIDHEDFHEGIIGLIAGKLAEEFYRPAIVFARGKKLSKASARSISGFNIIKALRQTEHLLVDAGGHPMAAGFTIETAKIETFKSRLYEIAERTLSPDMLEPKLTIDCEIELRDITWELYRQLERLEPFGIGNPQPRFALENCEVVDARAVGDEGKHLKLTIKQSKSMANGIAFNQGFLVSQLNPGTPISLAFTLDKNIWNNREELQLKVKDLKVDGGEATKPF